MKHLTRGLGKAWGKCGGRYPNSVRGNHDGGSQWPEGVGNSQVSTQHTDTEGQGDQVQMGSVCRPGSYLVQNAQFGLTRWGNRIQCCPVVSRGNTHSLTGLLVQSRVSRQTMGKFSKIIFH